MTVPAVVRKSIPITQDCLELACKIREEGSVERLAVEEVVGDLPSKLSESQAVSAMLSFVEKAIAEKLLELEYEDYAAAMTQEDEDFARAHRSRRNMRARLRERD